MDVRRQRTERSLKGIGLLILPKIHPEQKSIHEKEVENLILRQGYKIGGRIAYVCLHPISTKLNTGRPWFEENSTKAHSLSSHKHKGSDFTFLKQRRPHHCPK